MPHHGGGPRLAVPLPELRAAAPLASAERPLAPRAIGPVRGGDPGRRDLVAAAAAGAHPTARPGSRWRGLVVAREGGPQRGDTGVAVETEPLTDVVLGADEVGAQADLERRPPGCGVAVPLTPQPLHLCDVVAEALPGECVVVEVA